MVAKVGEWDASVIAVGFYCRTAEVTPFFSEGYVRGTSDVYAVAYRKPDGHIAFSAAGVTNKAGDYVYDVAEIIDVEVEGIIEQQVSHKRLTQRGKTLEAITLALLAYKMAHNTPSTTLMYPMSRLPSLTKVPPYVMSMANGQAISICMRCQHIQITPTSCTTLVIPL